MELERYDELTTMYIMNNNHMDHCSLEFDDEITESCELLGATYNSIDGSDESNSAHCHANKPANVIDKKARRQLILASILCLVFMIGEIVGGVLAGSLAIMTDAAHLLTDFASFMISLLSIYLASRPATKLLSFGWHRTEIIGALLSVLLIWVVTGILVFLAIQRVMQNDYEINATIMLITSGVGVAFNFVMGCTLHTHAHSHGGGGHSHGGGDHSHGGGDHSHDESSSDSESGQKNEHGHNSSNINVRAAFIHVIGDFIQSIGVMIAAFIIYFKPEWKIADPICTFIFSVLVLFTTVTILKDIIRVLMEATPSGIHYNAVKDCLFEIKGVRDVHNIRLWCLTMNKVALSCHLAIVSTVRAQDILEEASKLIYTRFGIYECTMQIENYVDDMEHCTDCKDPKD
ncbi:unnamed protein product [Owenia fusiformis]|uniref:Zinc transporter 2-like n=1 Tax=Owenia fusiformis TaxID=6347 RepID=A0A8S4N4E0_OWEFU|nr:unnamed protein product [Owenia fusiformis]